MQKRIGFYGRSLKVEVRGPMPELRDARTFGIARRSRPLDDDGGLIRVMQPS